MSINLNLEFTKIYKFIFINESQLFMYKYVLCF